MNRLVAFLKSWQDEVTRALEAFEPGRRFRIERWERPGGGGGESRGLEGGEVLERAGVNFSDVHGRLPETLAREMSGESAEFRAFGVSIVIHPRNPWAPTTHANFRCIARGDQLYFGGGADLTPSLLVEEDARHFHKTLKAACDLCAPRLYDELKAACDRYFYLPHRGEHRGVGGIFFDQMQGPIDERIRWLETLAGAFLPAYLPILERRRHTPYGDAEREAQLIQRGRYAEFNLVWDKGTTFGLQTQGRTESILMSLPPLARWGAPVEPEPNTPRAALLETLRRPREWIATSRAPASPPSTA